MEIENMVFQLTDGKIDNRNEIMEKYTMVDATRWLSIKQRNSEIENWYLNKDTKDNKKTEQVKFSSASEALKFMQDNKNV
jgi:hypothetical protein